MALVCSRATTIDLEGFAVDPRAAEWAKFREHYPRCPDCSREVARLGAIVAALGPEGSAHLTEEQLLAFATSPEGLGPEQRARAEEHLAGCAPCRTELAVLREFDFAALGAEQWSLTARLLEAVRRLGVACVPGLPKLALAAAAVVLIAVSVALWRADSGPRAEEPRVARSEPKPPVEIAEEPSARAPVEPSAPAPPSEPVEPEQPQVQARTEAPAPRTAPAAPEPQAPARPPPPAPEAPERPVQIAALLPSEAPRYVPGALAGGEGRRIGGAARSASAGAPAPQVLAPAHVGRTSHASPTLYWFLPEPTSLSVEVTVVDPADPEPLLEKTLPGPVAAGVHALRLAELGVRLAAGVEYPWFVTLVVDAARRSNDVVSGGSIRYEPAAAVPSTPPERLAHAYAEAGLWYDAFDQLSTWLAAEPGAALLHAHRAALLEQVGLDEAARYERGGAPGAE